MIINIRGTNGSGKSTLVTSLMRTYGTVSLEVEGKAIGYYSNSLSAYFVGRYATACGGCDTIKTQAETKQRVADWSQSGDVIFEGILVSTIFGPWLEFSKNHGGMIWAFLDTPLELCLERIQIRNGGKPIKTDQVKAKWEGMLRIADKARTAGERVIVIDHRSPAESLMRQTGLSPYKKVA